MRLSEFKDEKAIEVVADLLVPIGNIVANPANKEAQAGGKLLALAVSMLKNNATDVKTMLAVLNDADPDEYTCTAATVMRDVVDMLGDPELLRLFGLQSQTSTSAGSASMTSEVEE